MKTLTSYIFEKFRISKRTNTKIPFFELNNETLLSNIQNIIKEYNRKNNKNYKVEVGYFEDGGNFPWTVTIAGTGYSFSYSTLSQLYYSIVKDFGTKEEKEEIKIWKYDTNKKDWVKRK